VVDMNTARERLLKIETRGRFLKGSIGSFARKKAQWAVFTARCAFLLFWCFTSRKIFDCRRRTKSRPWGGRYGVSILVFLLLL